jgi:hypothetical protein
MARPRWCSAMRARSTRWFTRWLRVRSHGPHSARPCHASRARRPASNLYSHYVLRAAVLTGPLLLLHGELRARAAPDIFRWRGVQPRCARLLRGTAHRIALPSLPQVWSGLRLRAGAEHLAARPRRRWPPPRSARSRACRAPRQVAAGAAGARSVGARAPSSLRLCGGERPARGLRVACGRVHARSHARSRHACVAASRASSSSRSPARPATSCRVGPRVVV